MFLIIVLSVWTLMHAYVFWRASSVPFIARRLPRWALFAAGAFPWFSYLLGAWLGDLAPAASRAFEYAGSNWIGVLFLLLVCMLAVDIVTGFGFLLPRVAPTARGWALVAGCVLSAIAFVQAARPPVVRDYEVQMAGLPPERDGTVLVVGSDFHLGTLLGERWLNARIEQMQALRPDAVILAGDIGEGHNPSENSLAPVFRRLSPRMGLWAVAGNHEHFGRQGRQPSFLEQAGAHVLHDECAQLAPGLVLCGVDDLTTRRRAGQTGPFVKWALAGRPPGAATVLASHTPWDAETAASAGVGLMVSGHTHNGQIWPFNYFVRMTYPRIAGRYNVDGMSLIVCRGTGTWGPRMRLWYPNEILRITLRSPQKKLTSNLPQAQ